MKKGGVGSVELGLNWVSLSHIRPLMVESVSRTLNTQKVRLEGIFAIKLTLVAQVPFHLITISVLAQCGSVVT